MPNWKKVIVSGSDASLNSLNVTSGVTGSLLGSASYALTASYLGGSVASASYASTASLVNGTVNVTQATIGISGAPALYTTNKAIVSTGTTTVHSFSSGSYQGAFADYTISDGVNARAGQIQTIFLGGQLQYNETTTMDVGNTDDFVWQVAVSGIDINYNSIVASGTWTTKLIVRTI